MNAFCEHFFYEFSQNKLASKMFKQKVMGKPQGLAKSLR